MTKSFDFVLAMYEWGHNPNYFVEMGMCVIYLLCTNILHFLSHCLMLTFQTTYYHHILSFIANILLISFLLSIFSIPHSYFVCLCNHHHFALMFLTSLTLLVIALYPSEFHPTSDTPGRVKPNYWAWNAQFHFFHFHPLSSFFLLHTLKSFAQMNMLDSLCDSLSHPKFWFWLNVFWDFSSWTTQLFPFSSVLMQCLSPLLVFVTLKMK